jgi:phage-related protein
METFDFAVLNSVPNEPEIRVVETQYGDGYEQVSEAGINNVVDKITLTCAFAPKDQSEAERLLAFLRRHGRAKVFFWQQPWNLIIQKWRLESWTQNSSTVDRTKQKHEFTLKLKESFRP